MKEKDIVGERKCVKERENETETLGLFSSCRKIEALKILILVQEQKKHIF